MNPVLVDTATSPWAEIEMVTVGSQEIRVARRDGDGARAPLLLIGGFSCSVEVFEPFVDALRPGTGVISFDVPGTGRSPSPGRPYRLAGLAGLIARLLDTMECEAADVLGVSWGGALAQQFAHQEHPRCRRLVLVSTGPAPIMRPSPTLLRELVAGRRFSPETAHEVAPSLYGGKLRSDPSQISPLHRRVRGSRRGELYQQLALLGWTSLPFLRSIKQRTLILAGDDDPIVPMLNARIMQRLLPNAELHVFHDGHLGLLTSAREIAPMIDDFRERE